MFGLRGMDESEVLEKAKIILDLCIKRIEYHGHKIRKAPKIIVIGVFTKTLVRRWNLQTYSTSSKDMILENIDNIHGGYEKKVIFISANNTHSDISLVHTMIHEFVHDLQHRFKVLPAERGADYEKAKFEIEANEYAEKYMFEFYQELENILPDRKQIGKVRKNLYFNTRVLPTLPTLPKLVK